MKNKKILDIIEIITICLLSIATIVLDFVKIEYLTDNLRNSLLSKIVQETCGSIAAILLLKRFNIKLFGKPTKLLYLIPCFIIAIDNFQFSSFFNGNLTLVHKEPLDILLFGSYCLSVGLFEECIFRGIVLSVLLGLFPKDRKGFIASYITSSALFGLAHIINGISIQIAYTMLTGCVFAFCFIKTKNIFCCALVHGVYNFCGLLFDFEQNLGLGAGIVFDTGTVITMLIISVLVGLFIVYRVCTYPDVERLELYDRLSITQEK